MAEFAIGAVHSGFTHLDLSLGKLIERSSWPRPLLDALADSLERKTARRFAREGPGWAQLKESTNRDRVRRGYPPAHPILERDGAMRRSATKKGRTHVRRYVGLKSIDVGSRDPKILFHQYGTSRMAARPPFAIATVDLRTWRIMGGNHIMGRPLVGGD